MRRSSILLLVILLTASVAAFPREKTIPEMEQKAETSKPEDQAKIYVEIAQRQLKAADKLYRSGKADVARANIEDVQRYSVKATDAAIRANKRLKNTEIALRKMASKLSDMKRDLDYENQPPVQTAADKLQSLRNQLLSAMFGKKAK